jgi:EpsI family protein
MPERLRTWAPALILAAGGLLVAARSTPRAVVPREPLATIPMRLAGAQAIDVPVSEEVRRVAGMSEYVNRWYTSADSSRSFWLYVGYYAQQSQGQTIHSPKNCLPGAGWETLQVGTDTVATPTRTFVVNRYIIARDGEQALVYYWYQGRGRIESDEYRVKWNLLRDAALHGTTEEALARVIVPLASAGGERRMGLDERQAKVLARELTAQLIPELERVLPAGA